MIKPTGVPVIRASSQDMFERHFSKSILQGGYTRRDESGDYVVRECAMHWITWQAALTAILPMPPEQVSMPETVFSAEMIYEEISYTKRFTGRQMLADFAKIVAASPQHEVTK